MHVIRLNFQVGTTQILSILELLCLSVNLMYSEHIEGVTSFSN